MKPTVYSAEVTMQGKTLSGKVPKPFTVNVWSNTKKGAINQLKGKYAKVENVRRAQLWQL